MTQENKDIPVVSYSKISTYKNCPKQYKFAYKDKLPRLEKPYTIFGQFCHEVLERFHKFYLDTNNKDVPFEDTMKVSFYAAKDVWAKKITKEQLVEAYDILFLYLTQLIEQPKEEATKVVAVEKKIWLRIDDTLVLHGYIDRVQVDNDGVIHVVDYKTTKDPKYLKDRTQLLLYCYSLFMENSKLLVIRASYMLLKHKMRLLAQDHSMQELIDTKNSFVATWNTIADDKLYRASPIYFRCKMCDFIGHCKEGQRLIFGGSKNSGKTSW